MTDPIIRFNVGGDRYEISHDLIEQHQGTLLGTLVSKRKEESHGKELFIDRDGKTFRHVLNYMRYGSVCLPITASKKDFLRELNYYGIAVHDESACVQQEGYVDTTLMSKTIRREIQRQVKKVPSDVLARECYRVYLEENEVRTRISFNPAIMDPTICQAFDIVYENYDEEQFNSSLARYGLRWTRFEPTWGSIYIHVEATEPTKPSSDSSEKQYPSIQVSDPSSGPMECWMDSFAQDNGYKPHGPQGYGHVHKTP